MLTEKMERDIIKYNANTNDRPWFSMGTPVDGAMTVKDALEQGGCNFFATKVPVEGRLMILDENNQPAEITVSDPRHSMVVRTDTNTSLGVVGDKYSIVQMKDAFAFFDEALGEGAAVIDCAGMINGGRTGFLIAKLPDPIEIIPGDTIEKYLLFSNSFDGSTPVTCQFLSTRLVCLNQLNSRAGKKADVVKIRHTKNAKLRISEAHRILRQSESYWKGMKAMLSVMAGYEVSKSDLDKFTAAIMPGKIEDDGTESVSKRTQGRRDQIVEAFENSPGSTMAGKTAYGLYNALTWVIDHEATLREGTDRWEASLRGSNSRLRQKGFDYLAQLVGAK